MLLPAGKPVKTGVDPATLNLPEAMEKLRVIALSGYLRFLREQTTGIILFENGRLVGAIFQEGKDNQRFFDMEALGRIFDMSLAGGAQLDIFRLSPELVMAAHALLRGTMLYRAQDLSLVDIKTLMLKVKGEKLNGCLRIYAGDKTSLIFYENGSPLGFHHDGSTDIETTADTSMSVAKMPGALVDVVQTMELAKLPNQDLMVSDDLEHMWAQIRQQATSRQKQVVQKEQVKQQQVKEAEIRSRLPQMLRSIAEKDLGKLGPNLIEREFGSSYNGPVTREAVLKAIAPLERSATLIAGPQAIKSLMDDMRQAVETLFKS